MNLNDLINYLKNLTESRLVEVIYQVLKSYKKHSTTPEGDFHIEALCVTKVTFERINGLIEHKPLFEIIALPVEEEYLYGNAGRQDMCFEGGDCPDCGVELISFAKRVNCPVCNAKVGLT